MSARLDSWGRFPTSTPREVLELHRRDDALPTASPSSPLLPFGNGRSYGDVCLTDGGTVLRTRRLDRFIAFDADAGIVRCEAGMLLDTLLDAIVPRGWFLPVTPGTRFVTVGGAIANDVHGKNHHRVGSFGRHVRCLELVRSDGSRRICSADDHAELFAATIAGLGLTGLITWAEIQLLPIPGPWLTVETLPFDGLDDYHALARESDAGHDYTVAWIDCLAPRERRGRGLFSRANFTATNEGPPASRRRLRLPFAPPFRLLSGLSQRAYNRLHALRTRLGHQLDHYQPFFYPLDGIDNWNRLYGPQGFVQHQCVIPPDAVDDVLPRLFTTMSQTGDNAYLAVLKTFGDLRSPGLLGFPRQGTTLALDFPFRGERTRRLFDRLNDLVADAGGAVYPAKDALMQPHHFQRFFPDWRRFADHIDPAFCSDFWRRVTAGSGPTRPEATG